MDRLRMLFVVALAVFAFTGGGRGCSRENENMLVSVEITAQPQGGSGVNTVSCTFKVTAFHSEGQDPLPEPAVVKGFWQSSHDRYNLTDYEVARHGVAQTFTSSKSAPEGMHLDKPFCFVLEWTDKDGSNMLVSDTAYCQ